jgi:hypothetical protein
VKKALISSLCLCILLIGGPAYANHAVGQLSNPVAQPLEGPPTIQKGPWTFLANFPAGVGEEKPLGVDVEMFTRQQPDGLHRYVITSTTTMGFSIFDVTDPELPVRVSDYGAAVCGADSQAQQMMDVLANGHDFDENSTAFGTVHGWEDDVQITPDGKIAVLGTDAAGRCHDPVWGGMEFVDLSDLTAPSLLGLVRLQGESHNTTIDQDRPWLIYNSNSDTSGNNMTDIVDFSSCLDLDPAKCLPEVARYQMKDADTSGTDTPAPSACHDITFARHKLWGACINTTLAWDPSGVWKNGKLTGTHMTDPAQVGEENACTLADPAVDAMVTLKVVDCSMWTTDLGKEVGLVNANLKPILLIRHSGINLPEGSPGRAGIQISHKSDPLAGEKLIGINDERGGGLGAGNDRQCPGAIWFYDIENKSKPEIAKFPNGKKALFWPGADRLVKTQGSNCTSHLFWEWKQERNLISAAWYSSGTQVFRYHTDFSTNPATVWFTNRYTLVLPGASTWTSRVFREVVAEDGTRTLYFVATDIARGFDFFKLTLKPRKNH